MTKAKAKRTTLDGQKAGIVKGMLKRGDHQHDVAAWFGINSGRIAEINTGQRFRYVEPIRENLPPSGP